MRLCLLGMLIAFILVQPLGYTDIASQDACHAGVFGIELTGSANGDHALLNALMHQHKWVDSSGQIDTAQQSRLQGGSEAHPPTGLVLAFQVPASWKARRSARPVMVGLMALFRTEKILA